MATIGGNIDRNLLKEMFSSGATTNAHVLIAQQKSKIIGSVFGQSHTPQISPIYVISDTYNLQFNYLLGGE